MVPLDYHDRDLFRAIKGLFVHRTIGYLLAALGLTSLIGLGIDKTFLIYMNGRLDWFAILLILNGLVVGYTAWRIRSGIRKIYDLSLAEFLILGIVQGIGALPGVSRMGVVMGMGLLIGLNWTDALLLTMLLALPTIFVVNLHGLIIGNCWGDLVLRYFVEPVIETCSTVKPSFSSVSLNLLLIVFVSMVLSVAATWWGVTHLSQFTGRRLLVLLGLYCALAGVLQMIFLGIP